MFDNALNMPLRDILQNTNKQFQKQATEVFCKKMFLEISQNSLENICTRASFLIKLQAEACNFTKKETLAQVFSCEFYKISRNTFLQNTSGYCFCIFHTDVQAPLMQ